MLPNTAETLLKPLSSRPAASSAASLSRSLDSGCIWMMESGAWKLFHSIYRSPEFSSAKLEFPPINSRPCNKWSLTHLLPHLMKKIFKKRGLHLRNCLKWFKGFKVEEERIDVYAASPWVELAQGLIREQQHTPPQTSSFHNATGFSLTIQGLIDEPLFVFQPCTFLNLKSQFILGKHIRRRERKKNFKTPFFPLLASTGLSFTGFQSTSSSLIVSGLHACHVPWRQPKLRSSGTFAIALCPILCVW